ncbi:hypothetical protein AU381_16770 [Sinorhizobium glycinis]|uniref:Uncharacterized protein n=1 Tax=Sinorhizobium glycinis TaxID=1472378 RepID=A0A178XML8_9HYPH|nr:hypothetical protein AU381_16770 [Sinorhizobium glycinis]
MASSASAAIGQSLSRGAPAMINVPRTEPGLVAAVTSHAVPTIARNWRRILAPHGVRIELSAVFTHQAPRVRFKSTHKVRALCELADLLLVVDDEDTGRRRASLIQAKMASQRGTVKISRLQDKLQLDLFQNWPIFDFEEPIYKLAKLNFHHGGPAAQCGRYGVIDRHWNGPPRSPDWSQMHPSNVPGKTAGSQTLADFIVRLVSGRAGRDATLSLRTDWSKTVDALMTITYARQFQHRATLGAARFPRGNSTTAYFLQDELLQVSVTSTGLLAEDSLPEVVVVDGPPPHRALSVLRIRVGGG